VIVVLVTVANVTVVAVGRRAPLHATIAVIADDVVTRSIAWLTWWARYLLLCSHLKLRSLLTSSRLKKCVLLQAHLVQ